MPSSESPHRRWLTAAILIAGAVAFLAPTVANLFPGPVLREGIVTTQAQCAAQPSTVWITMQDRNFCIRYYLSTAGGTGTRPVVYLEGDRPGGFDRRANVFRDANGKPQDLDPRQFDEYAADLSERNVRPGIYLARIGVDGSSGDHAMTRTVLELHVTNAALEQIKQRHGFDGFHLVGQSAGSSLIAGLIALRSDVGCAVMGAGQLVNPNGRWLKEPNAQIILRFNAAEAAPIIAKRRDTRIIVVTDPEDRRAKNSEQTPFVHLVRQAGGQVEQFLVQATDDERHDVTDYAHMAMTGCVLGVNSQEIALTLKYRVAKLLEDKAKADRRNTADKTAE